MPNNFVWGGAESERSTIRREVMAQNLWPLQFKKT